MPTWAAWTPSPAGSPSLEAPARGSLPASPEHDALERAMRRAGPADLTSPRRGEGT
ncbi:hypothetical protein [Streptomyces asoensis]|uniref:hypothetical protein n=1 Tax=Streptomyces asoensis TaxID=249586 RepID=UPI0033D0816A